MRVNPYTRLKTVALEWANKARHPHTRQAYWYSEEVVKSNAVLSKLKEQAGAVNIIGYDTIVEMREDGGLNFKFVKRVPTMPYELEY